MSGLPFELLLALRYLRPKRTFVSVITLISVLGVTLGVAVLIIVLSVMTGFDLQLRDRILGFNPHLWVKVRGEAMHDYPDVLKDVARIPDVKSVSPYMLGQVMLETQPDNGRRQFAAPYLRGIDPHYDADISSLRSNIVSGEFDLTRRGVLIGIRFAANMNLQVGDRVVLAGPQELTKWEQNRGKEGTEVDLPEDYVVRGIFDTDYFEYDASFVLTSLKNAQELYGFTNATSVHGLLVMIADPYHAEAVKRQLELVLGPDFQVETWMEANAPLLGALVVEKNVMFYLLFFIMIVAALCILSAEITFVVQKTREIGMLKALGATDEQVSGLFLSQSGFVGVVGVLAGFGLGMLAITYRNGFLHFMNRLTHFELFPASIYGFSELPAQIVPRDIALICGSALIVCVLGGLIPALRAGRLKPVEALRNE